MNFISHSHKHADAIIEKHYYNEYSEIKETLLNEIFIVSKTPKNPAYKITKCINKGNMQIDYTQGKTILNWLNEIQSTNGQNDLFQSKIVRALKYIYNNNNNFNINLLCNKISNYIIPVENNEYKIVTNIKEKYNKRLRNNELMLS